jgi:Cu/Ag efflux protein CusF
MKKIAVPLLATAFALFAAMAFAQQNTSQQSPQDNKQSKPPETSQGNTTGEAATAQPMRGTVSQIDTSGRSFVLHDQSGRDVTVYWDQTTRLSGPEVSQGRTNNMSGQTNSNMNGLKVGDEVEVNATNQNGKSVAASVRVLPKKSSS